MIFILKFCLSGLFWTNFFLKKSKIFDVRFIPSPHYYELYGISIFFILLILFFEINFSILISLFIFSKGELFIISESLLLSSYFVKYFILFLFEEYLFTYDSISSKWISALSALSSSLLYSSSSFSFIVINSSFFLFILH